MPKVATRKKVREPKAKEAIYWGTGRRKEAVARVRLIPGKGLFSLNGKSLEDYFGEKTLHIFVRKPLEITNTLSKFNVFARINGGGSGGQAGALQLGIARALLEADDGFRDVLKKEGLLTRDPRMKERKKYGLKKARKRPQFSKR